MMRFRMMIPGGIVALCGCSGTARTQAPVAGPLVADTTEQIPGAIGTGGSAYKFASRSIGETRSVLIGLPKSYAVSTRLYPVIIVLDGEANFRPAMTVVGELSSLGHVPESIVIGIPNTNRLRDLTPPGISVSGSSKSEGGDRFLDFVEKELMPALKTQFRANGMVVLVGHSSGGLIVTYAAATRPAFRLILSLDSPTHLDDSWIVKKMVEATKNQSLSRLRYVSLESRFGYNDSSWARVKNAAPPTWILEREKLDNETHVSLPFFGMYVGLRDMFADYATNRAPQSPTSSTLAYYHDLEKLYGGPLIPPAGLLRQVIEDFEMEGQSRRAHEGWHLLVDSYGMPKDSADWQQRLAKLEKMPPLTETVESILATPRATAVAAKDFLGEWRGQQWINEEDKNDVVLRLRDSAGVVVGEMTNLPEPGEMPPMRIQYLKVVGGGVEWGYMNGMRPRGMLIYKAALKNGIMTGAMDFGGIRFVPPAGMPGPPTVRFELRKVK
ncbi:MAG: alpha/beta hydrolase-fold protein [Gemmatimonadales bacterium]